MAFDTADASFPSSDASSSPYEIWISEFDSSGARRDARVVKAAQEMRRFFLEYRRSELGCPSLANTLAEQAVDNVCESIDRGLVRDLHLYLKSAFRNAVNRYLHRQKRLVSLDFDQNDESVPDEIVSEVAVKELEQSIQMNEILAIMDPQTLSVFAARRAGYTGKEIAKTLGMSRNALYSSYSRGLTHVIETLGLSIAAVRENQQVHGSQRQRERRREKSTGVPHPKRS